MTRSYPQLLATLLLVALVLPLFYAPAAHAASITVTTTADEYNIDGDCALREAIIAANDDLAVDACVAGNGADTIIVPSGTYTLSLVGSGPTGGDLDISADLKLIGSGPARATIDAAGIDRVFGMYSAGRITISNLTITGGDAGFQAGGGILAENTALTLRHTHVNNNGPTYGIYLSGTSSLTMINSRVAQNAGGVYIQPGVTATILNSTINGNTSAVPGAGISSTGTLIVANSTISGNSSDVDGGGIRSDGTTSLYNVTITGNTASANGSGWYLGGGVSSLGGSFTLQNSIIGGNFQGTSMGSVANDCWATLTSAGYNLIDDTFACTIVGDTTGNVLGTSPLLGPLINNGGPTRTHALLAGSPAINAGNPLGCTDHTGAPLTTDQRGFARDSLCDMGAYEYGSAGPPAPAATPTPALP